MQTDVVFEQLVHHWSSEFYSKIKKLTDEKTELVKEVETLRKNLMATQKKNVKEKEMSQHTYSKLVEKYET